MGLGDIFKGIGDVAVDAGLGVASGVGKELQFQNSPEGRQNKRDQQRHDQSQASNRINIMLSILTADSTIRNQLAGDKTIQDSLTTMGVDTNLLKSFNKLGDENIALIVDYIKQNTGGTEQASKKFLDGMMSQLQGKPMSEILLLLDPFLKNQRATKSREALTNIGGQSAPTAQDTKEAELSQIEEDAANLDPYAPGVAAPPPGQEAPQTLEKPTGRAAEIQKIFIDNQPTQERKLMTAIEKIDAKIQEAFDNPNLTPEHRDKRVDQLTKLLEVKNKQLGNRLAAQNAGGRPPTLDEVLSSDIYQQELASVNSEIQMIRMAARFNQENKAAIKNGSVERAAYKINGVEQTEKMVTDAFVKLPHLSRAGNFSKQLFRTSEDVTGDIRQLQLLYYK